MFVPAALGTATADDITVPSGPDTKAGVNAVAAPPIPTNVPPVIANVTAPTAVPTQAKVMLPADVIVPVNVALVSPVTIGDTTPVDDAIDPSVVALAGATDRTPAPNAATATSAMRL
jgi:hypothetical protein